jgi:hypothetical protein
VSGKTLNVASGAWDYSQFIPVTDQPSATSHPLPDLWTAH